LLEPTVDAKAVTQQIDQITQTVKLMAKTADPNYSEAILLDALRYNIYHAGVWNEEKPFSYDMDDPLGRNINNKLLSTYLKTRKGNCVSMPLLVYLVGQRLGLEMTLATAPQHVFVMYRAKGTEGWINLETTSGANPARDEWLRQGMPMTDKSIENGLYLRPLDRNGVYGVIASTLIEKAIQEKRFDDTIAISDAILKLDAKNIVAIIAKASAYGGKMELEFHKKYPDPNDLTPEHYAQYQFYGSQNHAGFKLAEDLGWQPPQSSLEGAQ